MSIVKNLRHEILDFLSSIVLFRGLKEKELLAIHGMIEEIEVQSHDFIYRSGDPSDRLFIIRYGEVMVRIGSGSDKVRYLGSGEIISELSLLSGLPHTGSAQASLDTILYTIRKERFLALIDENKTVNNNLMKLVSTRMRDFFIASPGKDYTRRLICHIPLEPMEKFEETMEQVVAETGRAYEQQVKLISIDEFEKRSPEEIIAIITDLRKTYPLLHIFFTFSPNLCRMNQVVMQSDQIVLWEQTMAEGSKEKQKILRYWKKCIRKFDDRSIRMVLGGHALDRQSYGGKKKLFIRTETLARYLVSKTRGVALGGGGARAMAHVGMLKHLEREDLKIDYIAGASFGAVVAALYARGENVASITRIMEKYFAFKDRPFFDGRIPFISFYRGIEMEKMLKDAFGDMTIEELQIPFVTSAVDLNLGSEVVFDKGPIWEALAATMSMPGVFPPRKVGNHLLIDGGVLNNVPESLIRERGANLIISANVVPMEDEEIERLMEPKSIGEKLSILQWWDQIRTPPILKIVYRTVNLESREIVRLKKDYMDFFISYKLNRYDVFDFKKYNEIISEGEKQFRPHLKSVKKLFLSSIT